VRRLSVKSLAMAFSPSSDNSQSNCWLQNRHSVVLLEYSKGTQMTLQMEQAVVGTVGGA
jgi:hypothetical protein